MKFTRIMILAVFVTVTMMVLPALGENETWDCPNCGRKGNTGNFCGTCAYARPDPDSMLQSNEKCHFVAAGDRYAVGILNDGTCVSTELAPDISEWENIFYICSSDRQVAGIRMDGTVVCTSALNVSSWYDMQMIEYASNVFSDDQHLVGLRKDGKVLATGTNQYGECDTNSWSDIVDVAAGSLHTVGLHEDGTVVAVGDNSFGQCNVESWTDIVDVAAARFSTYGLMSNGQIVASGCKIVKNDTRIPALAPSWEDIVAILADNEGGSGCDYLIGVRKDGTIVSNREGYVTEKEIMSFENVVSVDCASWGYIIVSDSAGKVYDIGWDADGHRNTKQWENIRAYND